MMGWLMLLAGALLAGGGGELFVRGAVGIARWARVAPGIIGVTVAAFATSSPELVVAVTSAIEGVPEISLGNALGANVTNVALILGLALCLGPMAATRDGLRRDLGVAVLAPLALGALAVDGVLSRWDGVVLLALFLAWNAAVLQEVRRQRSAAGAVLGDPRHLRAVFSTLVGFGLLLLAGQFIVSGGLAVAKQLGLDEFVVGATLVAIGTTVPELATAVIARVRGHDEVGLGTLLGSNIFNGLCIVGMAATLHPIGVDWRTSVVALAFGVIVVIMMVPGSRGGLSRRRGVLLLLAYGVYLAALVEAGP